MVVEEYLKVFGGHLVFLAAPGEPLVAHLAFEDAGAEVEGVHEQVEVRVDAVEVLCVVGRQGLEDGGLQAVERCGEGADELLVALGKVGACDAVGVDVDGVEGAVGEPQDAGLVEHDAQAEFPVVPDAALGVPGADVLEEACAEHHALGVEHSCEHLHAGVGRGDEGAHFLAPVHFLDGGHGYHVVVVELQAREGGQEVVVEVVVAVEEIDPLGLAGAQALVACGGGAGEGLAQQGAGGAVLDVLLAELVGSVGAFVIDDDDFGGLHVRAEYGVERLSDMFAPVLDRDNYGYFHAVV